MPQDSKYNQKPSQTPKIKVYFSQIQFSSGRPQICTIYHQLARKWQLRFLITLIDLNGWETIFIGFNGFIECNKNRFHVKIPLFSITKAIIIVLVNFLPWLVKNLNIKISISRNFLQDFHIYSPTPNQISCTYLKYYK